MIDAQHNLDEQKKEDVVSVEPLLGVLLGTDTEVSGGEAAAPPLLDMPKEAAMLTEEERRGLFQSVPPPRMSQNDAPVLSLDFLNIELKKEL